MVCCLFMLLYLNGVSCDEDVLYADYLLSCFADGIIQNNQYTNALHTTRIVFDFACVWWIDHYSIHNHAPPLFAVANGLACGVDECLMYVCFHCYALVRIALLTVALVALETLIVCFDPVAFVDIGCMR
jgi:hypothetical protein